MEELSESTTVGTLPTTAVESEEAEKKVKDAPAPREKSGRARKAPTKYEEPAKDNQPKGKRKAKAVFFAFLFSIWKRTIQNRLKVKATSPQRRATKKARRWCGLRCSCTNNM